MATIETPAIIVETIAIHAPLEAVFAALTVPEQVVQWWGSDDSYHIRAMEADLRTGGTWRSSGRSRNGEPFAVHGVYRIVDPPRVVEFTWHYDWSGRGDSAETVVRYELQEHSGITQLTVTHTGFATETDRAGHATGWQAVLGWLREFVTRSA